MKKHLFYLLGIISCVYADRNIIEIPKPWPDVCPQCEDLCICPPEQPCLEKEDEIHVDLLNPSYHNGVLETTEGGVLNGSDLRIQAKNIRYTRKPHEAPPQIEVKCDQDVMIHYKKWILVGESLEFDLVKKRGVMYCATTASPPWFLGGSKILIDEWGDLTIYDAYLTTSEGKNQKDVALIAPKVTVTRNQIITLNHVSMRICNLPLLWLPKVKVDLKKVESSPFSLRFGWGGFLGTYGSLRYQFLSYHDFKGFARIDGFLGRGLGGGIETVYNPKHKSTTLFTKSYYAHDLSISDKKKRDRYRFQGVYHDTFSHDTASMDLMYDFVSDPQMASEYQTKDFALNTAGRTQLHVRKQSCNYLANLFARVKVNSFQNVNQQLPSFDLTLHPINLFNSSLTFENRTVLSFLDFTFSDRIEGVHNFSSGRFFLHPQLNYPLAAGPISINSKVGAYGIFYTSSPSNSSVTQALMHVDLLMQSMVSKCYNHCRHLIEPFAAYRFIPNPLASPDRHYLFTIQDAFGRFHFMKFGLKSSWFTTFPPYFPFSIELSANAFLETKAMSHTIPKGYLAIEYRPSQRLTLESDSGWNFEEKQLDFFNTRVLWTGNENLAATIEYRHRSRFDWRKADFDNFMLEAIRTREELLDSPLSDRRDTLLAKVFFRFHPDWSLKWIYRHGWNRVDQPHFTEYSLNVNTIVLQRWSIDFNYESRESDKRYSISMKLNNPSIDPKKHEPSFLNSQIFKRVIKRSRN